LDKKDIIENCPPQNVCVDMNDGEFILLERKEIATFDFSRTTKLGIGKDISQEEFDKIFKKELPLLLLIYIKSTKIQKLPDLSSCENLHTIKCSGCYNLTDLSGLSSCKNLHTIVLSFCKNLQKLPDLSCCKALQTIDCFFCDNLTDLSGLINCKRLHTIDCCSCKNLTKLPNLSSCEKLHTVKCSGCDNLTDLFGLINCKSLLIVERYSCEKLPQNLRYLSEFNKRLSIYYR